MKSPSFRDMEQLSAYLDGQLSRSEGTRLETRVQSDPVFAAALEELRQIRGLLRRTPQRRAPRNFTLTPRMAGIRPPVPRLVPALSWASAVAMLLFIFTLGTSLVRQISFGAGAPMLAAAPSGFGGGPAAAVTMPPAAAAPLVQAPATGVLATKVPASQDTAKQTMLATPNAETFAMSVPEATPPEAARGTQPPSASKAQRRPLNLWLFILPSLGVLLGIMAFFVGWLNKLAFQRKNRLR